MVQLRLRRGSMCSKAAVQLRLRRGSKGLRPVQCCFAAVQEVLSPLRYESAPTGRAQCACGAVQLIINFQLSTINYQLKSPTHVCEVGLSFLFSLLHPSYLTRPTTSQAFCKVKVIAVKEIARLSHFVIKLTFSAAKLKHLFQSCKHFVSFLHLRAHFVFSTS